MLASGIIANQMDVDINNRDSVILERLSHGDTAQQIADRLGTTLRTVNFRLSVMYAKFDLPEGKNKNIKLLRAAGYINP